MADSNAAKKQKPAEDPAENSAEGGQPKDKKSLVLMILVIINSLVLLAVGGGLFMYVQTTKKVNTSITAEDDAGAGHGESAAGDHGGGHGAPAADAHGGGHGGGEKKAAAHEGEAKIVSMDPFYVNLSGSEGYKLLKVTMSFEVDSTATQEEIVKRQAQIKDIIIILLSSKNYGEISGENAQQRLKDEIMDTINSFLAKGKVKKILFTEFIFN